jgi:hypothetical protein
MFALYPAIPTKIRQRAGSTARAKEAVLGCEAFRWNEAWRARVLLTAIIACKRVYVTLGVPKLWGQIDESDNSDLWVGKRCSVRFDRVCS